MAATFDTTEQRILKIIDDNRETIVEFARDIYDHAELGYKEFRTSKKFVDFMKSLQLPVQTDLAITGAKAYLKKEKAGNASLALIGEQIRRHRQLTAVDITHNWQESSERRWHLRMQRWHRSWMDR